MINNQISIDRIQKVESPENFQKYINGFEKEFKCKLPPDFIDFLQKYGGSHLSAAIEILEPNPFGNRVNIDTIFRFSNDEALDELRENTIIGDGFPVAIPFADDLNGNWFYLYLGHENTESKVFFFDIQNRFYWSDEQFHHMFENLAPEIVSFLDKRKKNLIPKKKDAFNNFYLVGETMAQFMGNLIPVEYDDE
jgi:hypothetical protein